MNKINYVIGDATQPIGDGKKIISHICNNFGGWGAGFVLAISARWRYPEDRYRAMPFYELGTAMVLEVEPDIYVANMIAQHGIRTNSQGVPPIRYDALKQALKKVNKVAVEIGATLHMPRIGCGLAGATWDKILPIIEKNVTVDVIVYDLK